MNSFAGIFWLVLAQLQNQLFAEHLPVAACVRCLKEKEWKKWNSVFIVLSLTFFCGIARFSRGNKNKLRAFQPQKWKTRTASLKQNLMVLIKKKNLSVMQRRLIQTKVYYKLFYSVWEETSHKPLEVAAPKKLFWSVFVIDTTWFDRCFLFHVTIGRHCLHKFFVTQSYKYPENEKSF